ncbi:uncharacterized protein [Physcomitrium patens]|uniref:Uncharacterized protein n=1 Tax=Physcomitrium patens TaxID=3218 RepID=A0A7I4DGD2_PHYPA|nr:uncharacterized protein LOC112279307 isoform X2 [Physcomitrium patens]|eukprot:XP_024369389.1 uncharacterized protein LOC112279307 isoform X2 [Physcomitrella patens]
MLRGLGRPQSTVLHRETNGSWKCGPEVEAWNRPNWCILGVSLCEFFAEVDAKGIQKSPDVTASESTDIGTNGYIVICGMDELNRVE